MMAQMLLAGSPAERSCGRARLVGSNLIQRPSKRELTQQQPTSALVPLLQSEPHPFQIEETEKPGAAALGDRRATGSAAAAATGSPPQRSASAFSAIAPVAPRTPPFAPPRRISSMGCCSHASSPRRCYDRAPWPASSLLWAAMAYELEADDDGGDYELLWVPWLYELTTTGRRRRAAEVTAASCRSDRGELQWRAGRKLEPVLDDN